MKKQLLLTTGMVTLSWFATGSGMSAAVMGEEFTNETWTLGQWMTAGSVFTLSGLVQLSMVEFLGRAILPRSVSPMKTTAALLFASSFAFSVTFGLSMYGEKFGVLSDFRNANVEVAADTAEKSLAAVQRDVDTATSKLSRMSIVLGNAIAHEQGGGEGPRYKAYLAMKDEVDALVSKLETIDIGSLNAAIAKVSSAADLKVHLAKALNVAEAELDDVESFAESILKKLPAEETTSTFVQSLQSDAVALQEVAQNADVFERPSIEKEISAFAWAKKTWGTLFTAPSELDQNSWIAILLAVLVDGYITAFVVLAYREKASVARNVHAVREHNSQGLVEFSKLVSNAGYESSLAAVSEIEKNSNLIGTGRIVLLEAPRTTSKLANLISALGAAGIAKEVPLAKHFADLVKRDFVEISDISRVQAFLISTNKWQEIKSYQLIEVTTTKLTSDMTFGEFLSAFGEIPAERAHMGSNIEAMISRISRHFPEMLSTKMVELDKGTRQEFVSEFTNKMSRRLSHQTRVTYVSYLYRFFALAEAQKLLPREIEAANTVSVKLKAA